MKTLESNINNNLAFIHIPKTAGRYFYNTVITQNKLEKNFHGHKFSYHVKYPEYTVYKPLSFTFNKNHIYTTLIRNPFDLLYSFFYTKNKAMGHSGWGNAEILFRNRIKKESSFKNFIDYYIDPKQIFFWPPLKTNIFAFAYDKNENYLCKETIFFENLTNNIELFCKKYNLLYKEEKINENFITKKPFSDYKQAYTTDQVKRLEKIWEPILTKFNYSFE
jgi:hypothetical protein